MILVFEYNFLNQICFRKVHKYGKSTTGESWDIVVDEETYYEWVCFLCVKENDARYAILLPMGSCLLQI